MSFRFKLNNLTNVGFTLAEVLITLGIIGIVAALTIPNLMSKYREKVAITKVKKFYTTMSQVHLRSIADNGEIDGWDWVPYGGESNNEIVKAWFNKYWAPYLKDVEIIDRKVLKDDELKDDGIVFKMADGSIGKMGGFSGGYLHIGYYLNMKALDDPKSGVNSFLFGFAQKKDTAKCKMRFNTYGCDVSDVNALKNNSTYGCYSGRMHVYCAHLLQVNNWEVPRDYPYKF